MGRKAARGVRLFLLAMAFGAAAHAAEAIDWERARALHRKEVRGESLNADERAYLQRAIAERRRQPVDADRPTPRDHTGLVPLDEMSATQHHLGREGGLYGHGENTPPPAQLAAAQAALTRIRPLDAAGRPAADGRVGFLSVGMSNTTQEFSRFMTLAAHDPEKSPHVVCVDGAQGGQTAEAWARTTDSAIWRTVAARLRAAGVTPAQVQVVWLKQANARPTAPFPAHADQLANDLARLVRLLKQQFPNLQLAYLSSRTYGGYATTPLNPEPYAYESAFAVRDVILRQVHGDPNLAFGANGSSARAPVLLWGPYLWADGVTPRQSDGLVWRQEDFGEDGTHPSAASGRDKVARLLLSFLKTDPTARIWFTAR